MGLDPVFLRHIDRLDFQGVLGDFANILDFPQPLVVFNNFLIGMPTSLVTIA